MKPATTKYCHVFVIEKLLSLDDNRGVLRTDFQDRGVLSLTAGMRDNIDRINRVTLAVPTDV